MATVNESRSVVSGLFCLGWLAGALLAICGCHASHGVRDPEFVPLAQSHSFLPATHAPIAAATMPSVPMLAGEHPVEEYVWQALTQNPQIQARRKRVEAAAQRVPQAASLQDPTLSAVGYPFYPHVPQTASGRMTVDLMASQEVPWPGKLRTQANAAEAEVDMARAELVAAELQVIEQVKRAYFELYYVQRALEITRQSRQQAVQLSQIAEARYKAALVSQQDWLRAELAVLTIDTELLQLDQQLHSGQARLARLLHVSPDTPVRALAQLPSEQLPQDLQSLYEQAIAWRPELHAQLAAIRRDRIQTDLARLQYYPDLAFSFGWDEMTTSGAIAPSADGIDNLSIGLMANIPVYRKRLDAGVREAEAKTVASAREYDDLRDRTQEEIKDLFAQASNQEELLDLFRTQIVPKADQTLLVSIPAYEATQVDFQQVSDNWQQLLRYQIMQERLEAQFRQSLASLERVVGGDLVRPTRGLIESVPSVESEETLPAPELFLPESQR